MEWQYDREAPESFTIRGYPSPLVIGKRVYVGFSDGYLACLSTASGDVTWARSLAGDATRFMDVDSTPLFYQRHAVRVGLRDRRLRARSQGRLDASWRFDVEGADVGARRAAARLYFTAAKSGLHALDLGGPPLVAAVAGRAGGELSAPTVLGPYLLVSSAQRRHLRRRRALPGGSISTSRPATA